MNWVKVNVKDGEDWDIWSGLLGLCDAVQNNKLMCNGSGKYQLTPSKMFRASNDVPFDLTYFLSRRTKLDAVKSEPMCGVRTDAVYSYSVSVKLFLWQMFKDDIKTTLLNLGVRSCAKKSLWSNNQIKSFSISTLNSIIFLT